MTNTEVRHMATEVEPLLDYAATSDICDDPLVVDLATALTRATNKLTEIDSLMQEALDGASPGDVLFKIDTALHEKIA